VSRFNVPIDTTNRFWFETAFPALART